MNDLKLVAVGQGHPYFKHIRSQHYVKTKRTIGQQIHYLIFYGSELNGPIGIISGGSSVYSCKPRDNYFDIDRINRHDKIKQIINNVVFRLEKREKNLASRILKLWRNRIIADWYLKYKIRAIGFETFVYGGNRNGGIYLADNWDYVGMTKGSAKKQHNYSNPDSKHTRLPTKPKMIFCKRLSY